MSYEHYRESKLGDALVEALGELVQDDKISQELALKVLVEVRVFTSSLLCQGGDKNPISLNAKDIFPFAAMLFPFSAAKLFNPKQEAVIGCLNK